MSIMQSLEHILRNRLDEDITKTMEFLDDLSVASIDLNFESHLNDSNEFFARRHSNHETNSQLQPAQGTQQLNNENNKNQVNCVDLPSNRRVEKRQSKPLTLHQKVMTNNHANSAIIQNNDVQNDIELSAREVISEPTLENIPDWIPTANNVQNNNVQDAGLSVSDDVQSELTTEVIIEMTATANSQQNHVHNGAGPSQNSQINASRQVKPTAASKTSSNKTPLPSRQYEYGEEYRRRRENRMKKLELEEQEARKCIAKPMPHFNAIHMKAALRQPTQSVVVSPKTPQVLRRGLQMKEKQKQKIEEYGRKQAERPPIVARSCGVLQSEPFKPKLVPHYTNIEPFDLKMSDRLVERKQWEDERERERMLQKELEDKKKQKDEERIRKLIRQQTVFKARPNPFK